MLSLPREASDCSLPREAALRWCPPCPPHRRPARCKARGRVLAAPRPLARPLALFPYRCEDRCCVPARSAGCSPAGLLAAPALSHTLDLFDATPLAPRSFPQPLWAPHLLLMLLARQFPGRSPAPCVSAPFLETQGTASSRPQPQQPQHPSPRAQHRCPQTSPTWDRLHTQLLTLAG